MAPRRRAEIHLTGQDTGGAFCMLLDELPPGWALPPHRHAGEVDARGALEAAMRHGWEFVSVR